MFVKILWNYLMIYCRGVQVECDMLKSQWTKTNNFFSGLVQARESIVFWPLEVIEEDTLPLLGMVAMQALW